MEIQFQQRKLNQKESMPVNKTNKFKARNKPANEKKFIGVRQRPSGRWVAEIKDTTQKIRLWLGTFKTAEEAARAYDEAACLLRGSNTRTNNFITKVSLNSPLASRIKNLLNKKNGGNKEHEDEERVEVSVPASPVATLTTTSSSCNSTSSSTISSASTSDESQTSKVVNDKQLFDDVYKPDLQSDLSWYFGDGLDCLSREIGTNLEFSEFERMKVERQISASLYAYSGVQEYMETFQDSNVEAIWDLPPLCSSFR